MEDESKLSGRSLGRSHDERLSSHILGPLLAEMITMVAHNDEIGPVTVRDIRQRTSPLPLNPTQFFIVEMNATQFLDVKAPLS